MSMLRRPGATLPPGALARNNHEPGSRHSEKEVVTSRPSRGLEQFFAYIRGQQGLSVLDLAGASQDNINFITNLGHRLYSEDFLRSLDDNFAGKDPAELANSARIESFLGHNLNFDTEQFDAVLVWDVLQFLPSVLLAATLERLGRIVRPKSYMLAYFHADEKSRQVPFYSFRIKDQQTVLLAQRGFRKPAQLFNNRSLEKLFQSFDSVKFFLTGQQLRELIVRR